MHYFASRANSSFAKTKLSLLVGFAVFVACNIWPIALTQAQSAETKNKAKQQTEQKPKNPDAATNKNGNKNQKPVAPKRVKELMRFVKKHHPEVIPLMEVLKKNRPERYSRVLHGLDREVLSLERTKQRSPDDYQVALKQWVNRSRVRLLTAKVSTAGSIADVEKIRKQIRRLLSQNQKLRIKMLEKDLKEAQARAKRIADSLKELKQNGDEAIEKKIQSTTKIPYKLKSSPQKRSSKETEMENSGAKNKGQAGNQ